MDKAERLINLYAMLSETRRPLTADRIRHVLYEDQSETAFRRMFERDKEELRDLGINVGLAPTDVWGVEEGYLIDRDEATLGGLQLTPDEQAALWLVARMWRGEDDSARRALLKLSAVEGDLEQPGRSEIALEASTAHLGLLLGAIADRARVRFRYRTSGASEATERIVEPHQLSYRGGWYLTGFDRARAGVRHFKLSRIDGAVSLEPGKAPHFEAPPDADPGVPRGPWEGTDATESATVAFGPASAWWVERRAPVDRVRERDDGWVELRLPVADRTTFLTWVLGFGADAEILEPAEMREQAIAHLRRLIEGDA